MTKALPLFAALPLILAGCEVAPPVAGPQAGGAATLPEGVLSIAAPYQDLSTARVDETTGCYVYQHRGPVETTYLPLRSTEGRPICTRAPDELADAG